MVTTPTHGGVSAAGLCKQFQRVGGEPVLAVDDISLEVRPGEFLVLLGPSGCGKTTLLRCIAGLERPERGEIVLDGRTVFSADRNVDVAPERRRTSMLFQSYALWPHMSVFDNVAYPLRSRRVPKAEIPRRVSEMLSVVRCDGLEQQYPKEISGGQQQRVALARALVSGDSTILFDEPLSNIDAAVRAQMRTDIISLQRRIGFSAIYVTHDQTEAMALADRIAVLDGGRIAQLGTPEEIYRAPNSAAVARFVGTVNEIPGTISWSNARSAQIETPFGVITAAGFASDLSEGDDVVLMVRPELCHLSRDAGEGNSWKATIKLRQFMGSHSEYLLEVSGVQMWAWSMGAGDFAEDDELWISVDARDVMVFERPHGNSSGA